MRPSCAPLAIRPRMGLVVGLALSAALALPFGSALSREPDRTLKLYFGHTGERGEFTYKRNGRYDRKELERINNFLRDWRKEESTRMDPQLLDLVWEVYKEARARDYIHVVSAYRSPKTNSMLRKRSSGVAKNSQHTRGKALDFYIPDVPLKKLRAIAMKKQGGGVGYYPSSGSPFVHLDTGSVRAWPRMSRKQLLALFPNGETLHLPPSGQPLPGYERALAQLKSQSGSGTTLAYLEPEPKAEEVDRTGTASEPGRGGVKAWLKRVFPGDGQDGGEAATATAAVEAPPVERETETVPQPEPATAPVIASIGDSETPRMPRARPQTETELALAQSTAAPTTVTPADSARIASLADSPPPPRARPDPVFLASSLGYAEIGQPLPVAGDAFAALTFNPSQQSQRRGSEDPVSRAFAASDGVVLPSEDDRAVIASFAAMRAEDAPGVPSYGQDRDAMRGLVATPAAYDPEFTRLAMPVPAEGNAELFGAPEAEEVSDLNSEPQLPVDHFTATEPQDADERSFFARLVASLIE